jgi:hypothetical protein
MQGYVPLTGVNLVNLNRLLRAVHYVKLELNINLLLFS